MSVQGGGVFITWRVFQRRTESLASMLELEKKYYYYSWEDRTKLHKAWSYIIKTKSMLGDLLRINPSVIIIQLPPTPIIYIISAYCRMTGSKYIADCHNAMLYNSKWLNWPYAKYFLRRAEALLVHNEDVKTYAKSLNLSAITLRDPLPDMSNVCEPELLDHYKIIKGAYIIVPWSFASDEPINELIKAASTIPQIKFVMTWFAEKLTLDIRNKMPPNLVLTGYLQDDEYNMVFAQAAAALVLSTREGTQPSGASEAISLEIPLIVSDLATTKKLYGDMPIYVKNTAEGIQEGVRKALDQREQYTKKIRAFSDDYEKDLNEEINEMKALLKLAH
jgi:hypothetical protein